MNIGETIRKYRKEKNMTQEQMAERLGVTAPAVNKWEKGNSLPDIMLLSPVARLLGISLDVLLSYQEELSDHEADKIIEELNEIARQKGTEHAYKWFKGKLELYPNSTALCVKGTLVFDVARMIEKPSDTEKYDTFVITNYERGLLAKEQEIRELAADSLFSFYMRKEDYKKAEAYLSYFPQGHPHLKRQRAALYHETGRRDEAYKLLEEMLFEASSKTNYLFHFLYRMAMEEKDIKRAKYFVDKQKMHAELFEMGKYHKFSAELELAVYEKDVEKTIDLMENLLECIDTIYDFSESPLYGHMKFSMPRPDFMKNLKSDLLEQFCDEENFSYMKENERWQRLKSPEPNCYLKNQKIH